VIGPAFPERLFAFLLLGALVEGVEMMDGPAELAEVEEGCFSPGPEIDVGGDGRGGRCPLN
jgi:hypothetical protein